MARRTAGALTVLAVMVGGGGWDAGHGGGRHDGSIGGVRPLARDAAVGSTPVTVEGRWAWPTGSRVVLRPFEPPANDYGPGHRGLDVAATIGGPALAPADGHVAFAGQVAGRGVVTIDHGGGLVSTIDSVAPTVGAGDSVVRGQGVGTVTVGHCPASAPCLHLGARIDDRYVDPRPYLGTPAWPVLLPIG
ncbi:murein hydrolase activator EnvC family protein [Curtobacterium sp. Leaf261]|uniref:murein hydrolase activator EnvC family protein n=1 Tax=Curtobacterium sp. Leaf261 TaxID=1736311 RepID=UPI00191042E2|nr:M23 family metallopeptidase [Curtobacterium sp. Leaf261]